MKVLATFLFALLILNIILPVVPISVEAQKPSIEPKKEKKPNEPLAQRSTIQSSSKEVKMDILGRQSFRGTLGITANLDLSLSVKKDGNELFRMQSARPFQGREIILSNSSMIVLSQNQGPFFIYQMWHLEKLNTYKLDICWNLPTANQKISFPINNMGAITGDVITNNGVIFDWSDATKAGFKPTIDKNKIELQLSNEGCLDPILTLISTTTLPGDMGFDGTGGPLPKDAVSFMGNAWYTTFINNSIGNSYINLACSIGGGPFNSQIKVERYNSGDVYGRVTRGFGVDYNGTHVLYALGWGHLFPPFPPSTFAQVKVYKPIGINSNCGITPYANQTVVSSSVFGALDVTHNSTGSLYYLWKNQTWADYILLRSNASGLSWARLGTMFNGRFNTSSNWEEGEARLFNYTNGNIMACATTKVGGNINLTSRIYYPSNSSFGNVATIAGGSSYGVDYADNFTCIPSTTGKVFAMWMGGSGALDCQVRYSYFSGSSWSAPQAVASPGCDFSVNQFLGMSKNTIDDTIVIFRKTSTNRIEWNRTNNLGTVFADNGIINIGDQSGASKFWMATSIKPNATGFVGITWVNNTGIYFLPFRAFSGTTVRINYIDEKTFLPYTNVKWSDFPLGTTHLLRINVSTAPTLTYLFNVTPPSVKTYFPHNDGYWRNLLFNASADSIDVTQYLVDPAVYQVRLCTFQVNDLTGRFGGAKFLVDKLTGNGLIRIDSQYLDATNKAQVWMVKNDTYTLSVTKDALTHDFGSFTVDDCPVTIILTIGDIIVVPDYHSRFTDITMQICRRYPGGVISANYTDTNLNTLSLQILIYNSTGTKYNQTFLNNNTISITYASGDTNLTHSYIGKFVGSSGTYGVFTEIRTVAWCLQSGKLISLDPFNAPGFVGEPAYNYLAIGILMILSLAFGAWTASTGAVIVSLLAGFFMLIGWLPISGVLVAVAVFVAAFNKLIQSRRGVE